MTVTYEVCPVCSAVLNQDHEPALIVVQIVTVRTWMVQIEATLNDLVRTYWVQNVMAQIDFPSARVPNVATLNALGARSYPVARVLWAVLHCVKAAHCAMVHCAMAHYVVTRCVEVALHYVEEVHFFAGVLRCVAVFLPVLAEHCLVVVCTLAWMTRYVVPVGTARRVHDLASVFHLNPNSCLMKAQLEQVVCCQCYWGLED
jgi:hypothetical protein